MTDVSNFQNSPRDIYIFTEYQLYRSNCGHVERTWQIPVVARSKAWVCGPFLLGLWVRIPALAWVSFCCDCRTSSGRGLCDGPITRPGESHQAWRV